MTVACLCIPVNRRFSLEAPRGIVRPVSATDLPLTEFRRVLTDSLPEAGGPPPPRVAALAADLRGGPLRSARAWAAVGGDGRVLGLIGLLEARGRNAIRHSIPWLVVAADARRRRVGTRLVAEALAAAAGAGAEHIWVETRSNWPPALAFWHQIAGTAACPPDG